MERIFTFPHQFIRNSELPVCYTNTITSLLHNNTITCLLRNNTITCLLHSNTITSLLHNNTITCLLHSNTITCLFQLPVCYTITQSHSFWSQEFGSFSHVNVHIGLLTLYCSLMHKIISTKRKSSFLP